MFVVSSASTGNRQSLPPFYRVSSATQSDKRGSPNVTKNPYGFFVTFGEEASGIAGLFEGLGISFGIHDAKSKQIEFGAAIHRAFD